MSNPFSNIVTTDLLDTYDNAIRGLIYSLQTSCTFYYSITKLADASDTSVFNNSPNPFIQGKITGLYPNSDPNNMVESETSENTNVCLVFNYKDYQQLASVNIPQGDCYTITEIDDTMKIKKCKYAIFDTDKEYFKTRRFQVKGESNPIGFRNNFFITSWELI